MPASWIAQVAGAPGEDPQKETLKATVFLRPTGSHIEPGVADLDVHSLQSDRHVAPADGNFFRPSGLGEAVQLEFGSSASASFEILFS
jgi:hypothetical protein